jgi:hypothetical protein
MEEFKQACLRGDLTEVKRIVDQQALCPLGTLEHIRTHISDNHNEIFRYACRDNYLSLVQWLIDYFQLIVPYEDIKWCFYAACDRNHLEIAKWLIVQFKISPERVDSYNNLFCWICVEGNFEAAQWLADWVGMNADNFHHTNRWIFYTVCHKNYLEFAQWLIDRFGFTVADLQGKQVDIATKLNFDGSPLGPKFAGKIE